MNTTHNSTLTAMTVAERFRRRMRALSWEILDEAVVFFFQAQQNAERMKQALCWTAPTGDRLLAHH
ncbi:MAG: hypothetical protein HQM06_06750 [Magnetococcales bacterium]|nr:hypothetical protein [Magnetococcales bacterium]